MQNHARLVRFYVWCERRRQAAESRARLSPLHLRFPASRNRHDLHRPRARCHHHSRRHAPRPLAVASCQLHVRLLLVRLTCGTHREFVILRPQRCLRRFQDLIVSRRESQDSKRNMLQFMLTFQQARQTVIDQVSAARSSPATDKVAINDALGRILAAELRADRAYPPFDRSTRDGYAVRASDAASGFVLRCIGEIKAGDTVTQSLQPGACIQIMTGAAVPSGADAVVMIEHTHRDGDTIGFDRDARTGQNIVQKGSEAAANQLLLSPGARLGYAELAIAAQVGATQLSCYRRPRIAILSTGDEVVLVDQTPGPFQIRNSNSVSLAAQVRLVGGQPVLLGNAADSIEDLRQKIMEGLKADVLVLSGGVSMGKYDLVETVLKDLGAEFFFDAVAIRPGKPAVFGKCDNTFAFGLPGNPVSTMVTFELFV